MTAMSNLRSKPLFTGRIPDRIQVIKTMQGKGGKMYLVGERWFSGSLQAIFFNSGILIWIVSEIIIFLLTIKKDKKEKKTKSPDQLSIYAVMAGNIIGCLLALFTVEYLQSDISGIAAWAGIIILYSGISFRCYAVGTLKRFFTVAVKIKDGHKIIKKGPYAYLRHPAYAGSILSLLGMQLGIKSLSGLLIVLIIVILAYSYRIKVEEKTLAAYFGPEYEIYKKETKRIIPFIF